MLRPVKMPDMRQHLFLLATMAALSSSLPAMAQEPVPAIATSLMAPGLRVSNLERSIAFYQTALGLVPGTTLQHGSLTEVMLCADSKNGRLALILLHDRGQDRSPPITPGNGLAKIVLRVPDLAGVVQRMRAANYATNAIRLSGKGPAILMINDPDGYTFELVGNPPPAPSPQG